MKKLSLVSIFTVFIICGFAVSALTDFYVVPVTKEVETLVYEYVYVYTTVSKTGQTTSYRTGDDGDWESGAAWPSPRFTDNGDGTVTDNLTELVWLEDARCVGRDDWDGAIDFCNALHTGECGLSDGSSEGDWRLPNVRELQSLIDYGQFDDALPSDHLFDDVMSDNYWTSTTYKGDDNSAWQIDIMRGDITDYSKSSDRYIWPVRDAN